MRTVLPKLSAQLIDAAPDAIIMTDTSGEIVLANSQAVRLFGYAREELIGQRVELLVPEAAAGRHVAQRDSYAADPKARPMGAGLDLRARRKDGSEFPVEISLSPLQTEKGLLVISAIRDVTERRQAEERIRALNAELEERVAERTAELKRSNEDLQQFASVASHDLKEPLRTMSSYAQLLGNQFKGKLGEEGDEFISYIIDGARRMNALVEDLLRYSRAIDPNQPAPSGKVELNGVVSLAIGNLKAAVDESGAEITHGELPAVTGDAAQMLQLFQNLLSNAIKYRGGDPPRIHIGAELRPPNWIFSVADNGIGIDPRHADRVFQPFKRLHGRDRPGTGLGLAIAKKILSRHGGRIWIESEPGRGSTFCFTLPSE